MVVSLVDKRVLLVRDAWDVSSCFTIVVVAGPVAPTCAREGRVDGGLRYRVDGVQIGPKLSALAATAAHADENRADDRGGRDQAGVQWFHRHRRDARVI